MPREGRLKIERERERERERELVKHKQINISIPGKAKVSKTKTANRSMSDFGGLALSCRLHERLASNECYFPVAS